MQGYGETALAARDLELVTPTSHLTTPTPARSAAGAPCTVPVEDTTLESWNEVNGVDLVGVLLAIEHAARAMKTTGGGSVVVTSSAASLVSYPGFGIYAAGKAGLNGVVRAAAFDLGK
ncbi:SDR family NAD(P)-dependent oxidoreductase [Modestobacter excelsi]|uniref:SDR family NAD(P)-dependent oxidoreductase n=1 Tax=Modestobacter excelsi TaxID=2213161 RepID=UPI001C20D795|nr:SDR family NAD(P)-dependent oxidoreductase [Modestobacter excelsi]